MLLADAEKARLIDENSINKYKIPSALLMENAGMRVCDVALEIDAYSYAILVGKGNNGGDGSVAARHLICNGRSAVIILLCDEKALSGDARLMFETALCAGVGVIYGFGDDAKKVLLECDVIIDGILGIGATGAPDDYYTGVINFVNGLNKTVVAIDVPSGVNATNGSTPGVAMRCSETVTFSVGRLGLCLYPGKEYAGKVRVVPISFAPSAISDADIRVRQTEYIPFEISEDCHKGSLGRVLVAAGSVGMTGAAYIASTSALRCGSGVVTLCIPASLNGIMEQKLTEVMTVPVSEKKGSFCLEASKQVVEISQKYDCLVLGCGIGCNDDTRDFVNMTMKYSKCPVVLDADGINSLDTRVLHQLKNKVVITPHIGEMSRLTGLDTEYIKENLCAVATGFADEYGVAVVLKCATTIVAFPKGNVYVNTIGNSGMATAGSGDALAGIIASSIASGMDFESAVVNGVYLHSAAGDEAAKRLGKRFMTATDITKSLKYVLNREGSWD